jgi:tetratricopeptide (TPR) repeat protein
MPMRLARLALLFSVSLLFAAVARAQSVRWEPSDADPTELILMFENCSPDGAPRLPPIENVQADLTGQGTRTEFVNFKRTDYVQLTYRLRTRSNSPVSIPAFEVKTDKGNVRVPAFTTAAPARNPSLENAASAVLQPGSPTVWAGEVFPLSYILTVSRRNFNALETAPEWNTTPLVAEDWGKPEAGEHVVNGEAKLDIVYRTRAFAKASGSVTLNGVGQIIRLQTGSASFGLFQSPRLERLSMESDHPVLTVRALPAPAPAGFSGAVGQFKLVSKVVPETASLGEPITWTLELSGTGNWTDIAGLPARDVSKDFQIVQPKAKRTPAEGKLFDVTLSEDVVLVPTKGGTYQLGPVNFVYFDPKSGTYKTLTAPRTAVTIAAPAAPAFNLTTTPAGQEKTPGTGPGSTEPARPVTPPAPPAGIPRDPLPGSETAGTPLATSLFVALLAAPFAALLGFWGWLAVRRARQTDPLRAQREAHARLAATIAQLRAAPPTGASPQLLLAWQRDTAVLWQLSHAAPPATALGDAAWSTLWIESDRALYGANPELPSDWTARAAAALAAKPVPGFNALRLFLPRNLFPFAALLFLALALPSLVRAEEAAVAYASGKFPAAEKSWREALAKNPTDWIAHHNLSLALEQQDRAGEAAAHAAAAFVQNPSHPAVQWHFAHASEKAGLAPVPLMPFLKPGFSETLARHASPAQWQFVMIGCAAVAALALGLLLANFYGRRSGLRLALSWVLLAGSFCTAVFAFGSWRTYTTTADSHAVIVWRAGLLRSIPTEADTTQKTSPLATGSVARVTRVLLGWYQLTFDNGQTGWVRRDDVVPFWQPPAEKN